MQTCNDILSVANFNLGQVITWLIVIAGWFVINHQHNRREDRKETREIIETVRGNLYDLEQKAVLYHTEEKPSVALSESIKLDIQRILSQIKTNNLISDKKIRQESFKNLRKSITYKNFDTRQHSPQEDNSDIVYCIHEAIDEVVSSIEESFRKKFPLLK